MKRFTILMKKYIEMQDCCIILILYLQSSFTHPLAPPPCELKEFSPPLPCSYSYSYSLFLVPCSLFSILYSLFPATLK